MKLWSSFKENLLHGIFPPLCLVCSEELPNASSTICGICILELPKAYLAQTEEDNLITTLFYGRVPIDHAFSLYRFEKEGKVQKLLHQIKYKDKPNLAIHQGEIMGEYLKNQTWSKTIDVLLPVPIHPKKKQIRGYNQSEKIAEGISKASEIPLELGLLQRVQHKESQTKQGRFNRWDNIKSAFRTNQAEIKYKHVAIVDDVITTGATIEKIANDLRTSNPDIQISILTLAIAL